MADPKITERRPGTNPPAQAPSVAAAQTDQAAGPRTTHPPGGSKPRRSESGHFVYETPIGPVGTNADGR